MSLASMNPVIYWLFTKGAGKYSFPNSVLKAPQWTFPYNESGDLQHIFYHISKPFKSAISSYQL